MAIPDYQACVLSVLKEARGRARNTSSRLVVGELGSDFPLTEEEMSQLLPSGSQHIFGCGPRGHQLYDCDSDGFSNWKSNVRGSKHCSVAYHATVFKVMIGSVGDVLQGRDSARDVIRNRNVAHSEDRGIIIRPLSWDTDTSPSSERGP